MQISKSILGLIVTVLLELGTVQSVRADSTDFIASCRHNDDLCLGYLAGFRDAAQGENSKLYCIPMGVSLTQLLAVYVKWAADNPNAWQLPVPFTVGRALHENFPC